MLLFTSTSLLLLLGCCSSCLKKVTLGCGSLSRQWMVQVDMFGGNTCLGFNLVLTTVGQQIMTKSFSITPSIFMLSL